jgi:MSHA biogenesis protein MshP
MYLDSVRSTNRVSRGFALVTAIFLVVVLSALGAFMLTFSTAQQQSSALDVLGSRAYQAARAGIEWGAFQVVQSGSCSPSSTVPLEGTLAVFTVTVSCSATTHTEAGTTLSVYQLTATATGVQGAAVGSPDYVERQIKASLTR